MFGKSIFGTSLGDTAPQTNTLTPATQARLRATTTPEAQAAERDRRLAMFEANRPAREAAQQREQQEEQRRLFFRPAVDWYGRLSWAERAALIAAAGTSGYAVAKVAKSTHTTAFAVAGALLAYPIAPVVLTLLAWDGRLN